MKKLQILSLVALALSWAAALTAPAQQVPPGAPAIVVIDPYATGNPHQVLVQVGGAIYWAQIQGPPSQPQPGPIAPAPADPNPPAPAPPSTPLALIAQKYLYWIPEYHKQMADALRNDPSIATEADMGKRLIELRDRVGNPMGDALAREIRTSTALDASGKIVDRPRLIRVFMDVHDAQAPLLKPMPANLEQ